MIHLEQHGAVISIRMSRSFLRRPLQWTAAYWVDGLLIDSGPPCTARELVQALRGRPVDQIVITHRHEDHVGGLSALRKAYPHARVYASHRTVPYIQEPERLQLQVYRRIAWGAPAPFEDVLTLDEIENQIESGDYALRVIETPGHTPDHISLFEPTRRWLFSGDVYEGRRDQALTPEADLFASLGSLRTLASLRPERMFTGHGEVKRTPLPDLHQKIGYLVNLAREVARLDAIGMTVPEMVACLFDDEPAINFWSMGHFSSVNLIQACRRYNSILAPNTASSSNTRANTGRGRGKGSDPSDSSERQSPGRSDKVR